MLLATPPHCHEGTLDDVMVLAGLNFVFTVVTRICAENSIDTMGMFLVLHRNAYTVAKTFSASCPTPPASGLGMPKIFGGDMARTADPNSPKGYSIPYGIMVSI